METFINNILNGDCINIMKQIPENSIDLIFADPPYFMQLENTLIRYEGTEFKGVSDEWDKFESFEHYDNFTNEWLFECKRVLKKNGSLWVIGSFQNIYRIGKILQDLDFWIMNDIIWEKANPVPNFRGVRFTNAHETLLWVTKTKKSKPTFNYKIMKEYNGGKQMKSVWNIPLCTGNERLKDKNGNKIHSTQKPEELLKRIILSTTKKNDVVLDPFFGTGTTGAVAKMFNRNFIGIEKEQIYIDYAKKRIDNINQISFDVYENLEVIIPRVSFVELFNSQIAFVGETLYSKDKSVEVTINKDGLVNFNGENLSIHKAAAKVTNTLSCNGWTFWYVERNNELILIDELRNIFRRRIAI